MAHQSSRPLPEDPGSSPGSHLAPLNCLELKFQGIRRPSGLRVHSTGMRGTGRYTQAKHPEAYNIFFFNKKKEYF